MDNKERLNKLMTRLRELQRNMFKSDAELEEEIQVTNEITFLLGESDPKPTKQLDQVDLNEDIHFDATIKPREARNLTENKLQELERQKKELNNLIKIANTQSDIDKLKEKLKEINQESNYITSKPDKEGMVHIREDVYKRRLEELQQELQITTGRWKRFRLQSKINSIKSKKKAIQTQNTIHKIGKVAMSISEGIGKLGNELSPLAKLGDMGEKKPKDHKGKKEEPFDFGFNIDNVFNSKYGNKQEKKPKKNKKKGKKRHKNKRPKSEKTSSYGFSYSDVFGELK